METSNGKRGKTANFWINYVNIIQLYHEFSRSIRPGDLFWFISSLPKITNYFSAFNQPNYARWTVKYHDNLLNLPETYRNVYLEFKIRLFGIERTPKSFSRSPIDLVLERTINADTACQRAWVSALTNSISARQRWDTFSTNNYNKQCFWRSWYDQKWRCIKQS